MQTVNEVLTAATDSVTLINGIDDGSIVRSDLTQNEINEMKKHLDGVYVDYYFSSLEKDELYKISGGPFNGSTGKVIESKKTKVKLEVEGLGMIVNLKKEAA